MRAVRHSIMQSAAYLQKVTLIRHMLPVCYICAHGVPTCVLHVVLCCCSIWRYYNCVVHADIASKVNYGQQTFLRFPENLLNSRARYSRAFQVHWCSVIPTVFACSSQCDVATVT